MARPLRKFLAFPGDNTGKDIWNGVSQGRCFIVSLRLRRKLLAFSFQLPAFGTPRAHQGRSWRLRRVLAPEGLFIRGVLA
jgi:hypothetical protein